MHYMNTWLKRCVFNLDLNRESLSELWHWCFSTDLPWVRCNQSAIVSTLERLKTRMAPKRFRCFVFCLQPLERLFLRSGEWGLHTALTGIHICYIHPPKPHSRPGHGTNVTPPDTGLHRPNSVSFWAGLKPGIPAQEAGALTRNAKGYSL